MRPIWPEKSKQGYNNGSTRLWTLAAIPAMFILPLLAWIAVSIPLWGLNYILVGTINTGGRSGSAKSAELYRIVREKSSAAP